MTRDRSDASRADLPIVCRARLLTFDFTLEYPSSLHARFSRQLAPWFPSFSSGTTADGLRIVATRAASNSNITAETTNYALMDGESCLVAPSSADAVLTAWQHWADAMAVRHASPLVPVHAGVVVWNSRAIVLPASTGAGKTTLVRALVAHGARYYSDEYAFIDDDGNVHAYPRALLIRGAKGETTIEPAEPTSEPRQPVPIGAIVDVRYTPDGGFALDARAASESVIWLLAHSPRALASARDVPRGLIRAAASARAWSGCRGEADEAVPALLARLAADAWW